EQGQALIVYPEGVRNSDGRLTRAEAGAGFLARLNETAVQPLALVGSERCLPKGAWWPRRHPVEMRWGTPLRINQRLPGGGRVTNQAAADAIMLAIATMLPPEMRGVYQNLEEWEQRLTGVASPLSTELAN
ncbi:MAG: lysophospholipid acyltransferase family protein, partial [Candidatus Dormibacteraceae bacterium]